MLIKTLLDVIDAPGSRSTANAESTENAISSLFRICIYKSDWKYVTNDYLVKSLKLLPIISEEVEAKSINRLFLKKYKERDPILFGKDDINADLVEDLKDRMKEYITSNPDTDFFTKEDIALLFDGEPTKEEFKLKEKVTHHVRVFDTKTKLIKINK